MDEIKFPDLKILPTKSLVLHEFTDPTRVENLKKRIWKGGSMFDPVLVSKFAQGRYLVLDGANRTTVFRLLKIPYILVQVVEYKKPQVKLSTWNHLVCDQRFKKHYQYKVKRFRSGDNTSMNSFVDLYKGRYKFYRVMDDNFNMLRRQYSSAVCLVVFPTFRPSEVVRLVTRGLTIPTGITRHLISGRALRVKISLTFLKNRQTLSQKNKWLKKYLSSVIKNNQVRYYEEPIFIFDE